MDSSLFKVTLTDVNSNHRQNSRFVPSSQMKSYYKPVLIGGFILDQKVVTIHWSG